MTSIPVGEFVASCPDLQLRRLPSDWQSTEELPPPRKMKVFPLDALSYEDIYAAEERSGGMIVYTRSGDALYLHNVPNERKDLRLAHETRAACTAAMQKKLPAPSNTLADELTQAVLGILMNLSVADFQRLKYRWASAESVG